MWSICFTDCNATAEGFAPHARVVAGGVGRRATAWSCGEIGRQRCFDLTVVIGAIRHIGTTTASHAVW
jgi:hypothetical protein